MILESLTKAHDTFGKQIEEDKDSRIKLQIVINYLIEKDSEVELLNIEIFNTQIEV